MIILLEIITDDLLLIKLVKAPRIKTNMWSRGVMKKEHRCLVCDTKIAHYALAFRPITNGGHRMLRICQSCINRLMVDKKITSPVDI